MLTLKVPDQEFFDEKRETFSIIKGGTLLLEHSLKSISDWESKWKKPFLVDEEKTLIETLYYIKCMTINEVSDSIYQLLSPEMVKKIQDYIGESMTATTVQDLSPNKPRRKEIITSEVIYYWMFAQQIPIECENWNISRLMALLEVFAVKNSAGKKMNSKDVIHQYRAINAARRAKYGSKG